MPILVEVFASIIRIFLLFFGLAFSFTLGNTLYIQINSFLYTISLPCLELISFLVLFIPPIAFYFGIHHKEFFWQREEKYNSTVFIVSFILGVIFTLLPLNYTSWWATNPQCLSQPDLLSKFVQVLGTGLAAALFAYLGMDIGVAFKHLSHHVHKKKHKRHNHHTHHADH